jgi:Xaa-Pro aminopeptidase
MKIIDRIYSLRVLMKTNGIDAYIITGTDPHLSEYLPDRWRTREWISGFTGSYGRVVVTHYKAILWTDSRYFLQAEEQLKDTGIEMFKDRLPESISYDKWLISELKSGSIIAIDGLTISASEFINLNDKLTANGLILQQSEDLLSQIWIDRPKLPSNPAFEHQVQFAGFSRIQKFNLIQQKLKGNGATATIITLLDDLAWSFNIRGTDIKYNPLVTGYGYIAEDEISIFIDRVKISPELQKSFSNDGITIYEYNFFTEFLRNISNKTILLDADRTTSSIYQIVNKSNKIITAMSVPTVLKSIKNDVEINGMRDTHRRDGAAMVNFLYWFHQNIGKIKITELTVCEKLKEFRSKQNLFMGESFHPIVGYAAHSAIVHYSVTEESDIKVLPDNLLLIDSGGQFLDGTTDITRTIAAGNVSEQQKIDFTLVLKGTIGLAKAVFPEGTKGYSLDSFARKPLWDNGINYGHGTGHGIGHFLCVHEGPMSIRQEFNPEPIQIGQIISDEPAFYREGEYGIRTENVILCKEIFTTKFGRYLGFETLTLCPIDQKLILPSLLSEEEIVWLNNYHARILKELKSLLDSEVFEWLKNQWTQIKL